MGGPVELKGPDLTQGVPSKDVVEGQPLLGHALGEPVMLVKKGAEVFAVGAVCTHYSGPLAEGAVDGDCVTCPWHHARFSLRTGDATAPAFKSIPCFRVETRGGKVMVTEKRPHERRTLVQVGPTPKRIVVVGGGAAGHSAVETLRAEGWDGELTLLSADSSAPYDRTNVSKDYLAGNAPEEWMPMRPEEWYREQKVALRLGAQVMALDAAKKRVTLESGEALAFDACLLATGADPVRLSIPGAELPHVSVVRSIADSRAIIARLSSAKTAVVLGASFIGLEVAASLRARGVAVQVVALSRPLENVLGPAVSAFVQRLHQEHGVTFHLGGSATRITPEGVTLWNGATLPADVVVAGIGVRPSLALAESAGLAANRGVRVNERLQTSAPGIWAAGDIARYPEPFTARPVRIEHWVHAQRQGRTAARNMLGRDEAFTEVPFFWSQHYDVPVNYVGHAERFDGVQVKGDLMKRDAVVAYREAGRIAAVVTVGRDGDNLAAERAFAKNDQAALEALVRG